MIPRRIPRAMPRSSPRSALAVRVLVVAALAGGYLPVQASTPTEQLHRFLTQTTTARGDFTQQSPAQKAPAAGGAAPAAAKPAVSRGSFEFLRPGKFRWSYESPYQQLIVSDGLNLFLYDKDLNQVTKRKLAGALPASPASILFGSNDFEHDFKVEDDGSADGIDWIKATPNGKDSLFERIRIGFRDGLPAAMQLRDSFGQSTTLAFDHVQRNPPLASEHFQYTPPPGVDVLEDQ
jgi:outer membrane lipoprotein carrier protein